MINACGTKQEEPVAMTTDEEKQVAMAFASAWDCWLKLENRTPEENTIVINAVHAAQDVIRCRVAKRADPDFWR